MWWTEQINSPYLPFLKIVGGRSIEGKLAPQAIAFTFLCFKKWENKSGHVQVSTLHSYKPLVKNSVLDGMMPSHGPRRTFRLASVLKKAYVEYADVNAWMDKKTVVHTQMYNIIQPQKNDIPLFCDNMDKVVKTLW